MKWSAPTNPLERGPMRGAGCRTTNASISVRNQIVNGMVNVGKRSANVRSSRSSSFLSIVAAPRWPMSSSAMKSSTLKDLESLRSRAAAAEGMIHSAFTHDFSNLATAGKTDARARAA